jgi:hypothetical protein
MKYIKEKVLKKLLKKPRKKISNLDMRARSVF